MTNQPADQQKTHEFIRLGLEPSLRRRIKQFRYLAQFPTETAAIRALLETALVSNGIIPRDADVAPAPPEPLQFPLILDGTAKGWQWNL